MFWVSIAVLILVVKSQNPFFPHCADYYQGECYACENGWWGINGEYGLDNCDGECPEGCIGRCWYDVEEDQIGCEACNGYWFGYNCSYSCLEACEIGTEEGTCNCTYTPPPKNYESDYITIAIGTVVFIIIFTILYCSYKRCKKMFRKKPKISITHHIDEYDNEYEDEEIELMETV